MAGYSLVREDSLQVIPQLTNPMNKQFYHAKKSFLAIPIEFSENGMEGYNWHCILFYLSVCFKSVLYLWTSHFISLMGIQHWS